MDDLLDRLVGDLQLLAADAVLAELLGHQVVLRDRQLLDRGVAGQLHHLHAIEQRLADRVGLVRGADEHHLGQIDRDLDVVVDEVLVLLGVEDLEHRGGGIAAHVGGELVDLVEHEHRVHRAGLLEASDDAAGQGADVRAAVAANLGLVANAAEGDADVLAPERARDRFA